MKLLLPGLIAAGISLTSVATAAEFRIGEPVVKNGMSIQAVYLQAVKMDMGQQPAGDHGGHHSGHSAPSSPKKQDGGHHMHHAGAHATTGDLHLEADVMASADNDWGFPEGAWIPYLNIDWKLTKKGSDWSMSGSFLPMIANDGPHYGDNLNLDGPGKYSAVYTITPPDKSVFPRHFDKETGVSEWWKPFTVSWEFVYTGTGKKGGY